MKVKDIKKVAYNALHLGNQVGNVNRNGKTKKGTAFPFSFKHSFSLK